MKIHHIGYIVKSIEDFEKNLIFKNKIKQVYDEIQKANLAIYQTYSDIKIELIQPISEDSFTWNSLIKNGNHYHHICYSILKQDRIKIISDFNLLHLKGPIPAKLFNNSEVYFYFNRNKEIIEFLIID